MRRGIFGGSFNPVHNGHIFMATEAVRILNLDMVFFIPVGIAPHKKPETMNGPAERMELLKVALEPYDNMLVLDSEVNAETTSYSVDTVSALVSDPAYKDNSGVDNEWFFITGIDAFLEIMSWKDPLRLLSLCDFAIMPRNGYTFKDIALIDHFSSLDLSPADTIGSGAYLSLDLKNGHFLHLLNADLCNISSTMIRGAMAAGADGIMPENSLPLKVESYILEFMNKPDKDTDTMPAINRTTGLAINALLDKKAENGLLLDLEKLTTFTRYLLICSAESERQVSAIADNLVSSLKKENIYALGCDGMSHARWVVVDYGDIMVHIFKSELRELYRLEEYWAGAGRYEIENFTVTTGLSTDS